MSDRNSKFTTLSKSLNRSGELRWGGESYWENEIQSSDGVTFRAGRAKPTPRVVDSAVGHWTFDNAHTGEGLAIDSSGNEHHGNLSADLITGTPSPIGESYQFNGLNRVFVPDTTNTVLDITDELSITAWVYAETLDSEWNYIVVRNQSGGHADQQYAMNVEPGGTMNAVLDGQTHKVTNALDLQKWHHLAMTWDGEVLRVYRDASLIKSFTDTPNSLQQKPHLMFGARSETEDASGITYGWNGMLSNVLIFDVSLTADEVGKLV